MVLLQLWAQPSVFKAHSSVSVWNDNIKQLDFAYWYNYNNDSQTYINEFLCEILSYDIKNVKLSAKWRTITLWHDDEWFTV